MLIRSQNKAFLLNFSNLTVAYIVKDDEGFVISRLEDENRYRLGGYSSEAKAMKVLDMIQEAYSEYQIMLNFSVSYLHEFKEKTDGFAIFQMPEDSEVEA
mgnify:CR=1 FL=1|jgi:hypothetical protein